MGFYSEEQQSKINQLLKNYAVVDWHIGRPVSKSESVYVEGYRGEKMNVGDVFRGERATELPVGAIVALRPGGTGDTVWFRVKKTGGWLDFESGDMNGEPALGISYEVIWLPPAPPEPPKPSLAAELRTAWLGWDKLEETFSDQWDRVADFVEKNFTRKGQEPTRVVDGDGDSWRLMRDGKYAYISPSTGEVYDKDNPHTWETIEHITTTYDGIQGRFYD